MKRRLFSTLSVMIGMLLPITSFANNILQGGDMEDADLWSVARIGADVPVSLTWGYTEDIPSHGEGAALRLSVDAISGQGSNMALYQPISVKKGRTYTFDCAFKAISNTDNLWMQVYILDTEPNDEGETEGMQENLTLGQLNSWIDPDVNTFDGLFSEKAVKGDDHTAELLTYYHEGEDAEKYFMIKIGTWDHVFEIAIDNLSLTESGGESNIIKAYGSTPKVAVSSDPVEGITITLMDGTAHASAVLTDLSGKICATCSLSSVKKTTIPASGLTSGIYLLQVNTENGSVTKKIIISQ